MLIRKASFCAFTLPGSGASACWYHRGKNFAKGEQRLLLMTGRFPQIKQAMNSSCPLAECAADDEQIDNRASLYETVGAGRQWICGRNYGQLKLLMVDRN
ncbi:hypothetical protein KCP77_14680 [Salmonella enterica subsp. enterica]|nr:hypothetical protein KCP77_14680 [Salmonella enterica subsp. enterica]